MGRRARNGNSAAIRVESNVRRSALALLLLLVLVPAGAAAQSPTGVIQGTVVEQLGGPVPGVAVAVTNTESGSIRRTRTDSDGRFSVVGLPPGTYEVLASLDGYASQRQERIQVGTAQTVVSRLEIRRAPMPETLTLADRPSMLEPRHSDMSSRIEPVEIDHLPLAERRVLDLVTLTAGIIIGSAREEIGTAGIDAAYTTVQVDGLEQWSLAPGPSGLLAQRPYGFSRSTVRDALVTSSAPPAAVGRSGSASVSLVTRSGSRVFSGQAFEYFRDTWLASNTLANARLERPTPAQRSDQFGGSLGGPIAPGHTFFASYDALREERENPVHLSGDDGAAGSALAPLLTHWTRTGNQHVVFLRTDHRLEAGGSLSLRYHQVDLDGVGLSAVGPRQAFNTAESTDFGVRAASATARRTSGSSLVNEIRALYLHQHENARPEYAGARAIIMDAGATLLQSGPGALLPHDTRLQRLQVAHSAMWAAGRHTVQAGADVAIHEWRQTSAAGTNGVYTFASPERFAAGTPAEAGDSFHQTFLAGGRESVTTRPDRLEAALFVQDKWLIDETLTLDAGLRLEGQRMEPPPRTNPSPELLDAGIDTGRLDIDGSAWGPRVGVAWARSPRHVARAAYAVVHGRTPVSIVAAAHAYNGADVLPVTLFAADGDPVPAYPARLSSLPSAARPGLVFFDREFKTARFQHAGASYEWEWMPTTSIAASYFHVRGDHLPRAIDINVGDASPALFTIAGEATTVEGTRFGPGPFPGFGRVVRFESSGQSRYNAVALELRRRLFQGWQYRVSYTLSKATDTAPVSTPVFPEEPRTRGAIPLGLDAAVLDAPSDRDIRHRLVLSTVLQSELLADRFDGLVERALARWRLGVVYAISSGLPYSAYAGADIDGDGNRWNDLAPGTGRNAFRRSGVGRFDLRVSRDFALPGGIRLTATGDMFNVFNGRHYREVDTTRYAVADTTLVPNARFGQPLDEVMPRTVQIGASLGF